LIFSSLGLLLPCNFGCYRKLLNNTSIAIRVATQTYLPLFSAATSAEVAGMLRKIRQGGTVRGAVRSSVACISVIATEITSLRTCLSYGAATDSQCCDLLRGDGMLPTGSAKLYCPRPSVLFVRPLPCISGDCYRNNQPQTYLLGYGASQPFQMLRDFCGGSWYIPWILQIVLVEPSVLLDSSVTISVIALPT
jgi:hypothetical protein